MPRNPESAGVYEGAAEVAEYTLVRSGRAAAASQPGIRRQYRRLCMPSDVQVSMPRQSLLWLHTCDFRNRLLSSNQHAMLLCLQLLSPSMNEHLVQVSNRTLLSINWTAPNV